MSIILRFQNPKKRFETLVRPHLRALYKRAYRLTNSEHDAEELIQELLIKLYEKHSETFEKENITGWMMKILYNLYIDRYRKENRNPVAQANIEVCRELNLIESSYRGPLQELVNARLHQQIHIVLASLNPEQQLLIVMHDMEGHTLPVLSEYLDIPLGTLKSRLHRARNQMKESLQLMEPFEQKIRLTF